MLNRDLWIRRELEFESFIKKLTIQDRVGDIQKLRDYGRQKLLASSPRVIKELFPELWEEYRAHSRVMEMHRRDILKPILDESFNIADIEATIADEIERAEWKWFAFRSHQIDGLERISTFFAESGKRSGYIKLPTWMWKTILFSSLIRVFCEKNPETRVLILSPKDIVNKQNLKSIDRLQAADTITGITQEGWVEDADGKRLQDHPNALVSTYQLVAMSDRNDKRFGRADVIILDELHKSFGAKTVEELKARYPDAIFIWLSATPYLWDPGSKNPKRAEEYVGECIMNISLPDAIESWALAPVRWFLVHTRWEEIDRLIESGEDINDSEYEDKIDKDQRTKIALKILSKYKVNNSSRLSRRTLVYCAWIDHTESTYKQFQDAWLSVARVHSRMIAKDIDDAIEWYKSWKYDIICNSDMLIEGFDDAKTSLLINLRPTRSLTNFEQMIGRAIRLDDENPGKIADIYNVTGIHSEEYTIYGLAKYYKKLQDNSANGGLVFPTKLTDVEHKIQWFKETNTLPIWTDEESVLLKQYFPEWYSYFFATNRQNLLYPWQGSILQSSEDDNLDMPMIIQTESVEKIYFPMDFEYFENIINLKHDYDSWVTSCWGSPWYLNDNNRFATMSGNEMTIGQYIRKLQKNTSEIDWMTPQQCLFWLEDKLWIIPDPDQPMRIINKKYLEDVSRLKADYEGFKNEYNSYIKEKSWKRWTTKMSYFEGRDFFYNDGQSRINLKNYLSAIVRVTWVSSWEDAYLWWVNTVWEQIRELDSEYLRSISNISADLDIIIPTWGKLPESEADARSFLAKNWSNTFITHWWLYMSLYSYVSKVRASMSDVSSLTRDEVFMWLIEQTWSRVIRSDEFTDPIKIKALQENGWLTNEYLDMMRRNVPAAAWLSYTWLRAQALEKIEHLNTLTLTEKYFQNLDNLKHDFGRITEILGRELTINDTNNETEFETKNWVKITIKDYIDRIQERYAGTRISAVSAWKRELWIVDTAVNKKTVPISTQYFLQTELVWWDYLTMDPKNTTDKTFLFSTQSWATISINTYLGWIDMSIREMHWKSKEDRIGWWEEQARLFNSWNSMNSKYFTPDHLKKDYESLKASNNNKPPTYNKNTSWAKFPCQNNENAPDGVSLETYIARMKIYIPECSDKTEADILKYWKGVAK